MEIDLNVYAVEFILMLFSLVGSVAVTLMAGRQLNHRSRDVIIAWTSLDLLFRHRQKEIALLIEFTQAVGSTNDDTYRKLSQSMQVVDQARAIGDVETLSETEQQLREALLKLQIEAENIPELADHPRFPHAMERVNDYIMLINSQGANYNTAVMRNNNLLDRFPFYMIAGWLDYETFKQFNYSQAHVEAIAAGDLVSDEDQILA